MIRSAWSPTPPGFARRWAAQGVKPDGNRATTIFDLLEDRQGVAVYPATIDTFVVLLARPAIDMLRTTINSREACAVPAWHSVHGDRLLCLRPFTVPHEPSWTDRPPYRRPMELSVALPDKNEIHIVYARKRLLILRHKLVQIAHSMEHFWTVH
ncbi:MAG TPA: hypothetical protein VGX25_28645 [Actinophytocola sp.]|uniref:hypothetical protein n=1 Tax=Actinophytocola sp. TaxID=1872138 RepID=UPI002DDD321C|nr:hypothetical protein [Actinophytocola sp.]HEV2783371.1 hypothetical protein [Actinophytocola sp.]